MALSGELGFILLFSILGGVLAVRFRQPSVLGLIIVGALVGPHNLGFIQDLNLINATIEIGAVLLLFTVGLEFSLERLLNHGLRAILIAAMKIGLVFVFSYYVAIGLGFSPIAALYIGVILCITSTVIAIRILEQKGFAKAEELPLLVTVLIIEDIVGVFALSLFSSLNTAADFNAIDLIGSILASLAILIVSYLVLKRMIKPIIEWLIKYSTEETITFISLGVCAAMSYLAAAIGLSPSVGAFLAGNIVSSLVQAPLFEKAVHPFILTFTALFFFSIGTIVDFASLATSIHIVLILVIVNIIAKIATIGFGSYLFANVSGRQAVFSGIAMLSVGEFSLLIAREATPLNLGIDLVSITSAVILLSSLAMSSLIPFTDNVYALIRRMTPSLVQQESQTIARYFSTFTPERVIDRLKIRSILTHWRTILDNLTAIAIIAALAFIAWFYNIESMLNLAPSNIVLYILGVLILAGICFPTFRVVKSCSGLLSVFTRILQDLYPGDINNVKSIFRTLLSTTTLFIVITALPALFVIFPLNPLFHLVMIILVIMLVSLLVKGGNMMYAVIQKNQRLSTRFKNGQLYSKSKKASALFRQVRSRLRRRRGLEPMQSNDD